MTRKWYHRLFFIASEIAVYELLAWNRIFQHYTAALYSGLIVFKAFSYCWRVKDNPQIFNISISENVQNSIEWKTGTAWSKTKSIGAFLWFDQFRFWDGLGWIHSFVQDSIFIWIFIYFHCKTLINKLGFGSRSLRTQSSAVVLFVHLSI